MKIYAAIVTFLLLISVSIQTIESHDGMSTYEIYDFNSSVERIVQNAISDLVVSCDGYVYYSDYVNVNCNIY